MLNSLRRQLIVVLMLALTSNLSVAEHAVGFGHPGRAMGMGLANGFPFSLMRNAFMANAMMGNPYSMMMLCSQLQAQAAQAQRMSMIFQTYMAQLSGGRSLMMPPPPPPQSSLLTAMVCGNAAGFGAGMGMGGMGGAAPVIGLPTHAMF
jgi:hypothetical protein